MSSARRTRLLSTFLLGALLALALPPRASVGAAEAPSLSTFRWPPPPGDLVYIAEQGPLVLRPGGTQEVLAVPEDRWFVLEQSFVNSPEGNPFTGCGIDVVEEKDGVQTLKHTCALGSRRSTGSGTGPVFRPGSRVLLRNETGVTTSYATILMVGYLRDAR